MTTSPLPPQHLLAMRQALALHQGGRIDEARQIYRQILGFHPDSPEVLTLLGAAECQQGNPAEGARLLGRSLELAPNQPNALHNRGNALNDLGRYEEAVASFDGALALRPDYTEAWFSRGNALRDLNKTAEAFASYDRALALEPGYAEAWLNRGRILQTQRRLQDALQSYDHTVNLEPQLAEAWNDRGNTLTLLGQFDAALQSYDRAVALDTAYAEAWSNRGTALRRLGRFDDAVASCDRALALHSDYAEALYTRGLALEALGRLPEAAKAFDQAMALKPGLDFLPGQALYARMQLSDWRDFEARRDGLATRIRNKEKAAAPFIIQALIDAPDLQKATAEIFAAAETAPAVLAPPDRHPPHDRIRVAYVSADFRNHPVAHLLAGVLESHDRSWFEIFAVSLADAPDDHWRRRIKAGVDHFFEASAMSDLDIARLIRSHEIDIAIDLNGWTEGYRSGVFAERAAPVQVGYLGYLGSMGTNAFDYILADDVLVPASQRPFYTEAVACLPCYQVNDRLDAAPQAAGRTDLGLPEDGFVFCSFNQNYKLTPNVFDSWMRILHQVPASVLWLYVTDATARANLKGEAHRRGIDPERLIFAGRVPLEDHLKRLAAADLFLDTHPYNAGATASNALRVGLPVLTRIGQSFAARMGASLLTAVGLPELITETPEAYEAMAVALATQPGELAQVKRKLADHLPESALFDPERGARALEKVFTAMYRRSQDGLPPA
jgi:predicted O-linked N-acetylglucosamine transferase (SPINDLY family)